MKKINVDSIFVGNISKISSFKLCISHSAMVLGCGMAIGRMALEYPEIQKESYKEDAILIKVANCGYVDIDSVNSISDKLKIKKCLNKDGGFTLGSIVLPDAPTLFAKHGDLFVESESLRPYQFTDKKKEISFNQLKKIRR